MKARHTSTLCLVCTFVSFGTLVPLVNQVAADKDSIGCIQRVKHIHVSVIIIQRLPGSKDKKCYDLSYAGNPMTTGASVNAQV